MKSEVHPLARFLSTSGNPKVSVVIPTYKRPQLLLRAVKSVLLQTEQDFEIIIVDDGSNDETAGVVASLQDSRIHFFAFHENRGGSAARNKGVQMAKGVYIAFLDSDDYWLPRKLEKQLEMVYTGSFSGDWVIYNALGNKRLDGSYCYKADYFDSSIDDIGIFLTKANGRMISSGLLIPRSTLLKYPFDESLRRFQDVDLVVRMANDRIPFFLCTEPLVIRCEDNAHRVSLSKDISPFLYWLKKMNGQISSYFRSYIMLDIARLRWVTNPFLFCRYTVHAFFVSPIAFFIYIWRFLKGMHYKKCKKLCLDFTRRTSVIWLIGLLLFLSLISYFLFFSIGFRHNHREFFITYMTRIADPVLGALSNNELKKVMPVSISQGNIKSYKTTHLEALGRLLSGMAPWFELGIDDSPEGVLREKYINLAVKSIHNATDKQSPDYMNFTEGSQPLVDAAYLAQALLRAPNELWGRLDKETKKNVIQELKSTRSIKPLESNWLFFSAMIESALLKFDGECDMEPIQYAIEKHLEWYKGDGVYGDGPDFHWDYYNSLVIHPMFLEVLQVQNEFSSKYKELYVIELKRARRYAAIQERLISPEGTYPPIGRSLAYRFGAFQLLSKIALMRELPVDIKPQQVRFALYSVIKRQVEHSDFFDDKGWLQIGVYGNQPKLAERYISTGSLYLCAGVFLVLGLPEDDDFWTKEDEDWTSKKIWGGENVLRDYALEG